MASDLRRACAAGAIVLTVMVISAGARADSMDGNKLYESCSPNSGSSAFCSDYVRSVADALMARTVAGRTACIPNRVTPDQMVNVAMRFIEAHPAERRSAVFELIAEALAEAFPCK